MSNSVVTATLALRRFDVIIIALAAITVLAIKILWLSQCKRVWVLKPKLQCSTARCAHYVYTQRTCYVVQSVARGYY